MSQFIIFYQFIPSITNKKSLFIINSLPDILTNYTSVKKKNMLTVLKFRKKELFFESRKRTFVYNTKGAFYIPAFFP